MKEPVSQPYNVIEGQCAGTQVCPLSRVQAGQMVCIKGLVASPETCARLRELGFCEEQKVRLLARNATFICQVCNARLGISEKLAESILVETLSHTPHG
ncbi:MAG TPA: FeoA family protein [Verrucomicrobiota bacterium]|nr:FeoA family protein [Verrucomicrobiota bacterium]HRT08452.1 FeoA family protein [Candidatus Paceibacterota bacterium]HRT58133.1 FeoA family protein [Candidatus Paceibacterota bacterium]